MADTTTIGDDSGVSSVTAGAVPGTTSVTHPSGVRVRTTQIGRAHV
jgi:uncharacterized protein YwbE